jgi:hypothetical protein
MDEGHGAPTARQVTLADSYLTKVPYVALTQEEVHVADLDPREYFLLSLLDPITTVETLLDICGMPAEEALALLDGLVRRGIICIPP